MSPNGDRVVFQVHRADLVRNSYMSGWYEMNLGTHQRMFKVMDAGEPIWNDAGEWTAYPPVWKRDSEGFYFIKRLHGRALLWFVNRRGVERPVTSPALGAVVRMTPSLHGADVTITRPTASAIAQARRFLRYGRPFTVGEPNSPASGDDDSWNRGAASTKPALIQFSYALDTETERLRQENPTSSDLPAAMKNHFILVLETQRSRSGAEIAWVGVTVDPRRGGSGWRYGLYAYNFRSRSFRVVGKPSVQRYSNIAWSTDARQIYYTQVTSYSHSDIFRYDRPSKRIQRLTDGSALLTNCSYDDAKTTAACVTESENRPQELALIRLNNGHSARLTNFNGFWSKLLLAHFEKLIWTNNHADTTFAHLVYPTGFKPGRRYPLIITLYRSEGFLRGGTGDEYPVQVFAANGYFVLSFDVLTSLYIPYVESQTGQDIRRTLLDWRSPLDSITQVVHQLVAKGLVDPNRIGIGGLSHGTEITSYAITHSNLFSAAIVDGGSFSTVFYYLRNSAWDNIFRYWGIHDSPVDQIAEKWKSIAPPLLANCVTAPLLMNPPDSEYLLDLQEYWELRAHAKPVEMFIYPNEYHVKIGPSHRLAIYRLNLAWYDFWLKNKVDEGNPQLPRVSRWVEMKRLVPKRRQYDSADCSNT